MKKAIRSFVAFITLILVAAVVLVSCDDTSSQAETTENTVIETTKNSGEATSTETTVATEAEETAHSHEWSSWNITVDATCSAEGSQERICSCGEKEIQTVAAIAHTEITDAAIPATCTSEGKTEGKHCSICNIVLVNQEIVPMLEHNYVNRTCSVCNYFNASEGLSYSLSTDGTYYSVSGLGSCTDENIFIPSSYQGLPVANIGYAAFMDCTNILSVTIPESVTYIEGCAFYNCTNITSISIPNSVTCIEYSAFCNCSSLTSINIPDSITRLWDYTFRGCTSLTSIILPESITTIDYEAFDSCTALTDVTFKGSSSKWNAINKATFWNHKAAFTKVHCSDGDVTVEIDS